MDNGQHWIEIEAAAGAGSGSYTWVTPKDFSDQCKIRLTDSDNINVYAKNSETFSIMASELAINTPAGGEEFVFDDIALITWNATPVAEVDIAYSADNGSNWNTIASGFDASQGEYAWEVPQNATGQGLIRISDSQDNSNFSFTGMPFSIVPQNTVGGPYIADENTLLLLHGEGNLYNQSGIAGNVTSEGGTIGYAEGPAEGLGKSIYFDNSGGAPHLLVPHNSSLDLTGDWTIELWFKPVAYNPGLQYLIWKPGDDDAYFSNYSVQLNEYWGNELYAFYFSGEDRFGVRTQYFPALGDWYHIAFVRNTGDKRINVVVRNAQRALINTYAVSDNTMAPLTNEQDLKIGFNFNGYIDEVRISDIVRTFEPASAEIPVAVERISISPNPASDFIRIGTTEECEVQIFSSTGICVAAHDNISPEGRIDISDLGSGIYLVLIKTAEDLCYRKVIVR
jgi:hypothetical protein